MSNNTSNSENFNKENPFRVPDKYFESLSDQIFDKIESKATKTVTPIKVIFKSQLALAASIIGFAILASGAYYFISDKTQVTHPVAIVQDTTDVEFSFVEEDHIIEALSNNTPSAPEVEGDDIISYLVEDGIDENLIAEAY